MTKMLFPSLEPWRGVNAWHEGPLSSNCLVDLRFGDVAATDGDSILQCAVNRAREYGDPVERALVGGSPAVNDYDFEFDNAADYYEFPIPEPAAFTIYDLVQSSSGTLGSTSNNRYHVAGWFGAAANRGACLLVYTSTQFRALLYQQTASLLTSSVTGQDATDWNLLCMRATSTGGANGFGEFRIDNLTTGDGPVSWTPLTAPRDKSTKNYRVGRPYNTYFLESGQQGANSLYNVCHTDDQTLETLAEYRKRFAGSPLTF